MRVRPRPGLAALTWVAAAGALGWAVPAVFSAGFHGPETTVQPPPHY